MRQFQQSTRGKKSSRINHSARIVAERLEKRAYFAVYALDTLASFGSTNVSLPLGSTIDAAGDVYGTTYYGNPNTPNYNGYGTVYEIAHGTTVATTLASFNAIDGNGPYGAVAVDSSGDVFGACQNTGVNNVGTVFELAHGSSLITSLATFDANSSDPNTPAGGVSLDSNGNIFGTLSQGGPSNFGAVFEIACGTTSSTTLANFIGANGEYPVGQAINSSGDVFGTTVDGGNLTLNGGSGDGTVFELAHGTTTITALASFNGTNGSDSQAGVTVDSSGNIFGTTYGGGQNGEGTVFEVARGTSSITDLVSFNGSNGANPYSSVTLDPSGNVFGTTNVGGTDNDGTVFEIPHATTSITTIATFTDANGRNPRANAVSIDSSGDVFGTTEYGGPNEYGTVFELIPDTSTVSNVYVPIDQNISYAFQSSSFTGAFSNSAGNSLQSIQITSLPAHGTLTLSGSPVSVNQVIAVSAVANLAYAPTSGYTGADTFGWNGTDGLAYAATPASVDITVVSTQVELAAFNGTNGTEPSGVALDSNGNLFGATQSGGINNDGTVFEIPLGSTVITALASFNGVNGANPLGDLSFDSSGNLFGATLFGGPAWSGVGTGDGTVFELARGSTLITSLASFNGTNGNQPHGGANIDSRGDLFGSTVTGGMNNDGTVFEIVHGTTLISDVAAFSQSTGVNPYAAPVIDSSGNLFGSTTYYGSSDQGTIFEILSGSTSITTLASVPPNDSDYPGVCVDAVGNLYGTTLEGGSDSEGSVFELAHGTGSITTLASFVVTNGGNPEAGLALDAAGDLLGTTSIDGPAGGGQGTVFELAKGTGSITTLASFNGSNGATPLSNLILGSGKVFGTTAFGGANSDGTVFSLTIANGLPAGVTASAGAIYTYTVTTNTLSLTSGILTFNHDLGNASGLNVIASGSGASLVFATDQHLVGLTLTGGATAAVESLGATRTYSNHNVLVVGTLGAASDPTFSIDSAHGSKLDLEDNDLIIHTGTSDTTDQAELATVQALAAAGRNVAPGGVFDGMWDGNGLTSSSAASVDAGLGYEQNVLAVEDLSDMFLGVPNNQWTVGNATENLGANDILVKYTYNGDLALDGAVDGNAATIFSSYFVDNAGVPATDYAYGDLNGDGSINGNDATIFSSLFGNGLPGSGLPVL